MVEVAVNASAHSGEVMKECLRSWRKIRLGQMWTQRKVRCCTLCESVPYITGWVELHLAW